jgi:isopropylmalate/homocitrate/citramalate synthase
MNIENQNQPATRETMAEYLDRLAADQIEAGMDATGADIKAAAAEIRKLTLKVNHMAAAMATVASREDQLASALFGLIEDRVQSLVETEFDNYDPTDHYNFSDAVAEHSSEPDEDRTRDIVREVIEGGSFTFHV